MNRLTAFAFAAALCMPALPVAAASHAGTPEEALLDALVAAIRAEDDAMIRDHLRAGADPNGALYPHPWGNPDGSTPFMVAAAEGNTEAMRLLMEAGADIGLSISYFGSALHAAARHGHLDAARLLLDAGVDGDVLTNLGKAPLHEAARFGHESVVMLLLERGVCVDCEYTDESGGPSTALGTAAGFGQTAIVERLLAAGADVNKPGGHGGGHFFGTPLARAARAGRADIVEILVAAGAEINSSGDTPLHGAALTGHLEIVRRLVALGADLDTRTPDGRTALTLARTEGHDDVAAFLEAAGAEQ